MIPSLLVLVLLLTGCQSNLPQEAPTVTPRATMVVGPSLPPTPTAIPTSTPMPTPQINQSDDVTFFYGPTYRESYQNSIDIACQKNSSATIYLDTTIGSANANILNAGTINPGEWTYIKALDLCNDTDTEFVYGWVVYADADEQKVVFYIWQETEEYDPNKHALE